MNHKHLCLSSLQPSKFWPFSCPFNASICTFSSLPTIGLHCTWLNHLNQLSLILSYVGATPKLLFVSIFLILSFFVLSFSHPSQYSSHFDVCVSWLSNFMLLNVWLILEPFYIIFLPILMVFSFQCGLQLNPHCFNLVATSSSILPSLCIIEMG